MTEGKKKKKKTSARYVIIDEKKGKDGERKEGGKLSLRIDERTERRNENNKKSERN